MAVPLTTDMFADTLDPHEELDFKIELADMLETDETIDPANWALEVPPESAALGLAIMSGAGRDAALADSDTAITFWLAIDPAFRDNPAFDSAGTALPLRITAHTSASPPRTRQRTFRIKVAQQ